MKLVTVFGIGMIAAMAFAGAASASTTLCKANELPCAATNQYTGSIVGRSSNATLLSSLGSVVCTGSEVKGTTEGAALSATVQGRITSVSFTGCTLSGSRCTVEPPKVVDFAAAAATTPGTMNGIMTVFNPSAHISECLNCTFGFSSVSLDVIGGSPAKVVANEEKLTREEGFFCPGESKWDATYTVSTPSMLWMAE